MIWDKDFTCDVLLYSHGRVVLFCSNNIMTLLIYCLSKIPDLIFYKASV